MWVMRPRRVVTHFQSTDWAELHIGDHLSATTLKKVELQIAKETIEQLGDPTDLPRQALELLQVPLKLRM